MNPHYPRIRIPAESGGLLVREGLRITFYMRHSHGDVSQGVERSLDAYLRAIGPQALGCYIDSEGEEQELDDAGWELTRRKLREQRFPIIRLVDAELSNCRYRFEYHGKDLGDPSMQQEPLAVCEASFWLPTEFLEEQGPARIRELARELASPLPFCSGSAGLSFNGDLELLGVPEEVSKYCFRYPGIDFPSPTGYSWRLGTRIRGPHWLTFLGQPVLGAVGGSMGLRARLHSLGVTVEELASDRAVVTLGEWPEAGDMEKGQTLPAYRELARVLEPWLYFEPRARLPDLSPEETRRWDRRFLDELP
jgi:hypothetical protein